MDIDLTKLITNQDEEIELDIDLNFNEEYLSNSPIRKLKETKFTGTITKLYDGNFEINGTIKGIMILPDDITLEDVDYKFSSEIEEKFDYYSKNSDNNLKIIQNRLDISWFLWQNILVEIPLKVSNKKNNNISLKGNGWRLITEEELNESNNSPFSDLIDKFNSRKE